MDFALESTLLTGRNEQEAAKYPQRGVIREMEHLKPCPRALLPKQEAESMTSKNSCLLSLLDLASELQRTGMDR